MNENNEQLPLDNSNEAPLNESEGSGGNTADFSQGEGSGGNTAGFSQGEGSGGNTAGARYTLYKSNPPAPSKKPPKKVSLGVLASTLIIAILVSSMATYVVTRDKMTEKQRIASSLQNQSELDGLYRKLVELDGRFSSVYIDDIDYSKVGEMLMYGYLAGTGDKYADYYTAEEYRKMIDESQGSTQGIGVNVIYNSDYNLIEVISVYPDSPAEKAGILPGDLVAYVGKGENRLSVDEIGYDSAISKIRGEAGTVVDITVLRGDKLEEVDFSIERGYFSDQSVLSHLYAPDKTVGIIKITQFLQITPTQFKEAVEGLQKDGATKLIVDLRYNGGGDRVAICEILDYILPEGPIFRLQQANGEVVVTDTSDASSIDIPMTVLVNGSTASAAELFAATMRDYERAKIVGETTYGKGCMQTFYPMSDGSVFKATVAMYYPPYSDNYDGIGIKPDVEVELDESLWLKNIYKITDEEDNQLAAAYKVLTEDK